MKNFNVSNEKHFSINELMLEIQDQLSRKGGSPINPKLVKLALQDIIGGKFWPHALELLSRDLVIDACTGSESIPPAKYLGQPRIDGCYYVEDAVVFEGWDSPGIATEKTPVEVHGLNLDATREQMFGSLGNFDDLCLTPRQINTFCQNNANWLDDSQVSNQFLFKVGNYFAVAQAYKEYKDDKFDGNFTIWPLNGKKIPKPKNYHMRVVVPLLR